VKLGNPERYLLQSTVGIIECEALDVDWLSVLRLTVSDLRSFTVSVHHVPALTLVALLIVDHVGDGSSQTFVVFESSES
jgi:hypothetical protein